MLADLPSEIRVRCDQPSQLAQRVLAGGGIDAMRLEDEGRVLVLSTQHPLAVYQQLPRWAAEGRFQIHELRSSNESLQTLFTSLMSIHRGER